EESLLNIARHGTAAHLQRLISKYRRVERLEAAAEAVEQYRRRYVHYRHDEDGMLVIEARLPVEIGEVVMRALDAAVEELYRDGAEGRKAHRDAQGKKPRAGRRSRSKAKGSATGPGAESENKTQSTVPAETSESSETSESEEPALASGG